MRLVSEPTRPAPSRPETPDVIELKALRTRQPELADAVDLQLALLEVHRRIHLRIPVPTLDVTEARIARHAAQRLPLVRFADVPAEPGDLRLVLRQTSEVLHRFALIEEAAFRELENLARDGDVAGAAEAWLNRSLAMDDASAQEDTSAGELEQAVGLALKPFLSRCADAVQPAVGLHAWRLNRCAVCGGEAEFGVIESAEVRRLICGQCGLRWGFAADQCPFCPEGTKGSMTSFATPDRRYQVAACEVCRRYLKSYSTAHGRRPVMPAVDTLATLPLDAAAIQRGYQG